MATDKREVPPRLTICAIGSSESTHVVSRVAGFAARGHRAYLICSRPSDIEGVQEIISQVPLPRALDMVLRCIDRFSHRVLNLPLARHLETVSLFYSHWRMLKQYKPDIIHVHYAYSVLAWLAAVADRHPLVVSVMGGDVLFDEQGSPTPRGKWLTLQLLNRADLITSKSDYLTSVLERLGGFGTKTVKVMWGIDRTHFRLVDATALRARLGLAPHHRVILSPKILQPFYHIHLIVEAMPHIRAAYPEAKLLITEYAADTAYRTQLAEQVQRLGLEEDVRFVGHVSHRDMPLYYNLADVTVAVPLSDGLPQTLLEGMACGVPNLLSRLPRYEELVTHEQSAYFIDASPQGIAEGVIRLFSDRELAERIVQNALSIIHEQADFAQQVREVESYYYALLDRPKRRRSRLARMRMLGAILREILG